MRTVFLLVLLTTTPLPAQGVFTAMGCLPTPIPCDLVVAPDIDGDGDIDAVVFSTAWTVGHVLLNDGAGNFTNVAPIVPGAGPRQAIQADVDGDGDPDIVTRNDTTVTVFTNNDFGIATSTFVAAAALEDLELVDADGDGDLDMWFTAGALMTNDGASFGAAVPMTPAPGISQIHAVDIEGDGDLDFYGKDGPWTWKLYRDDGTGSYSVSSVTGDRYLNHGDVNGDGALDFVTSHTGETANLGLEYVTVQYGDGAGGFPAGAIFHAVSMGYSPFGHLRPEVHDITGDGTGEIILYSAFGVDALFYNSPTQLGLFTGASASYGVTGSRARATPGDVDSDGAPELLIAGIGTSFGQADACLVDVNYVFPRTLTIVSGNDQIMNIGAAAPQPLTVQVTDTVTGAPIANAPVSFTHDGINIGLGPALVNTDAQGMASTTVTADPVIGGPFAVYPTTPGANPTIPRFDLFARWLTVSWTPATGVLLVVFINDELAGVPIILAADVPMAPVTTPNGIVHTSILSPAPSLVLLDGIGVFGPADPTLVAAPDYVQLFHFGPQPVLGVNILFQVYGYDAGLPAPLDVFASNPDTVAF